MLTTCSVVGSQAQISETRPMPELRPSSPNCDDVKPTPADLSHYSDGLHSSSTNNVKKEDDKGDITADTDATFASNSGGRLKFYKEGRCILEITHRPAGDRVTWFSIQKRVYWPPAVQVQNGGVIPDQISVVSDDSNASDATANSGGPVISQWFDERKSPSVHKCSPNIVVPTVHHRAKPTNSRRLSADEAAEMAFYMRPPPGVVWIRKRHRIVRNKRRRPFHRIKVAALILKIEAQNVTKYPKKRSIDIDRIKKASRLESTVTKLTLERKKKPKAVLAVPIHSWRPSLNNSTKVQMHHSSVMHSSEATESHRYPQIRIKSELCPVTETCTTPPNYIPKSITSTSTTFTCSSKISVVRSITVSTSSGGHTGKIKAETKRVPVKMLPITPTLARIKAEPGTEASSQPSNHHSPDHRRGKIEIGRLGSPIPSPRKRSITPSANGSGYSLTLHPPHKRNRLGSADSYDSSGMLASPRACVGYIAPIPQSPPKSSTPGVGKNSSAFSIDSIMMGPSNTNNTLNSPSRSCPARPVPTYRSRTTPPPRASSPPFVPVSPYISSYGLDPRLAHLAGVISEPLLVPSQSAPVYSNTVAAKMAALAAASINPNYYSLMAAAASVASQKPTPPPPTTSITTSNTVWTPPLSSVNHPPPPVSMSLSTISSPAVPITATVWPPQYRGEPKVTLESVKPGKDYSEMPLNLSLRK